MDEMIERLTRVFREFDPEVDQRHADSRPTET